MIRGRARTGRSYCEWRREGRWWWSGCGFRRKGLRSKDQVFITAFVRSHGSIKEMEQVFGVSYPTIKARLNRIAGQLAFVETNPPPPQAEVLERLKNGEITAAEAISLLEALK